MQRLALKFARETGYRAALIKAAGRAALKVRDAAGLALAAGRCTWAVAAADDPPEDLTHSAVWCLGQLVRLMAAVDALDEELDREAFECYRSQISGLEVAATLEPLESKVEAEAELRGERSIDRQVEGPAPRPRAKVGNRWQPCIRLCARGSP